VTLSGGERRVVVISRNPTMTWGLSLPNTTIDSVRPQHLDEWAAQSRDEQVDLIVLDVGDSHVAIDGVRELRANARLAPILLIGGDDPEWQGEMVRDLPGTHLLALPVDRTRLLHTAGALLHVELPPDTPAVRDVVVPHEDPSYAAEPPPTINLADRLGAPIEPPTTEPSDSTDDVHASVRLLLRRSDQTYGVHETAWAMLCDIGERVRHDAACLMLHDDLDHAWHVVAEHGLAQVERHMLLDRESWWIGSVVHERQAAIMTNDHGMSMASSPAPLARRTQLLACAIPGSDALVLLARDDDEPFSDADLDIVATTTDEANRLLSDAIDVRRLARVLAPLSERPERLAT